MKLPLLVSEFSFLGPQHFLFQFLQAVKGCCLQCFHMPAKCAVNSRRLLFDAVV